MFVLMMQGILFSFSFGFQADGENPFSQGRSVDQEGWRKRQYDEIGERRVVEGSHEDKNG